MKIAVLSDFHLGFGSGERLTESFEAAQQALELAITHQADLVLLAGDVFDASVPKQENWHSAFALFNLLHNASQSTVKITRYSKETEQSEIINYKGLPVIAIHGTHEFRSKDYKNALQVLEQANSLIYMHAQRIEVEKDGEKVVVHGLGGVPEKQALNAFQLWQPAPVSGATNLLMFHQSLKEFLPFDDDMVATLSLSDLPPGFDLYIDGHLHWHSEQGLHNGKFILPGSTIFTQMKSLESEKPKGIYLFDSQSKSLEFLTLPKQRKLYYHKIKFNNAPPEEVYNRVKEKIESSLQERVGLKPLIRLKLTGSLAKGFNPADLNLNSVLKEFEAQAIFSLTKNFAMESFKKKIAELRELQKTSASITELGLGMLEKNLGQTSFNNAFDVKRIFDLLAEGRQEEAAELLRQKKFSPAKEIEKTDAGKSPQTTITS